MKTNHLIALGTALVAISYGIGRYTYGLFVPEIRESLELGTAAIGTIASAGHAGYIVAIVLCMQLVRIFSPRTLMLIGGFSVSVGLLLITTAHSAPLLAFGLFIASTSAGWIWTATPDAVRQLQPPQQRDRILSWVNSGTGVGVLMAAPVALLLSEWRMAYVVYSLMAFGITLWAWRALPPMTSDNNARSIPLRWQWFVCPRSGPLLGTAILVGLVAAIYWTFAVDLMVVSGMNAPWIGRLFWFVSGSAGVLGISVAAFIRRYGIRRVIPVNAVVLALALSLIAAAPTHMVAILLSAVCFGVGFITITGLLTIWSVKVFEERPSAGLGAVLILIALGQVIGPVIAGLIAEQIGLVPVFYGGAVLALSSVILRPRPSEDQQMASPAHQAA